MRKVFVTLFLLVCTLSASAQDTIPPTVMLKGEANVMVCRWSNYVDSGVDVTDNIDSSSDIKIETEGTFSGNTKIEGIFRLRYKGTDKAGNAAFSGWRMIAVVPYGLGGCYEEDWTDTSQKPSLILEG